jgi:hypothetical protein
MRNITSYLEGLRRELAGARAQGRKNVADIEAEIKLAEEKISGRQSSEIVVERAIAPAQGASAPARPGPTQ